MSDDTITTYTGYITAATAAITSLVTCGKTLYPYIVSMLTALKEGISELASDASSIGTAISALVTQIETNISEIETKMAENGVVSESTVAEWLTTINSNLEIIKNAEA